LVMDYLAEVTMAILQKQRQRKPEAGYATDFVAQLRDVLPSCVERGIKVISNAGGVNPLGCKAAVEKLADELGIGDRVRVGVVLGDDIYVNLDDLIAGGETLANMDTGRPLADERANVLSANVYLGAAPVVRALELGANVVITGRVTDTGVTLAPMIHEFGWAADDWNRLAAGIVAGHIIECGTQCTGGNFTDWHKVKSYSNLGFPLVEVLPDGTFTVTKHPGTGGLVSVHTISEQLLYEMGAPQYLAPDCIARFDSIRLTQDGPDRVKVTGIVGEPPPEKLKVSISFAHGYRAFGRLIVSGPDALAKAEKVAQIFWESAGGPEFYEDATTQFLAWNGTHPSLTDSEPSEIIVQVAVRDGDEKKINSRFGVQVVPRVLGSVPGITYFADMGRPRASDIVGYWPALISRTSVPMRVVVGEDEVDIPQPEVVTGGQVEPPNLASAASAGAPFSPEAPPRPQGGGGQTVKVPLSRLCLARSGDKGDTCNVGVLGRSVAIYGWMVENLTPAFVKERFAGICKGDVDRYEVPNLLACNFLLHESLGGGGTMSLLLDAQGKTFAQFLLATEVEVEAGLLDGAE
ncbi:MAG: acyclic terpene utilization AtuA family protein, partial [Acidimicrobiia bacterium]